MLALKIIINNAQCEILLKLMEYIIINRRMSEVFGTRQRVFSEEVYDEQSKIESCTSV